MLNAKLTFGNPIISDRHSSDMQYVSTDNELLFNFINTRNDFSLRSQRLLFSKIHNLCPMDLSAVVGDTEKSVVIYSGSYKVPFCNFKEMI